MSTKAGVHYSAEQEKLIQKHVIRDDGVFPNSQLPVLFYPGVLLMQGLFPAGDVKDLFASNGWSNSWQSGIFTFQHYHSNTHEVIGVVRGETTIILGGDDGLRLKIQKGDVLVLPAGVAHKNLGPENSVVCVGAYPRGKEYDMMYGAAGERPNADNNIKKVKMPEHDPVFGSFGGVMKYWGHSDNGQ